MIKKISFFVLMSVFILFGTASAVTSQTPHPVKSKGIEFTPSSPPVDPAKENEIRSKIGVLQIPFIKNESQIKDPSVRFYANTFTGTVFVTDNGITYSLKGKNTDGKGIKRLAVRESLLNAKMIKAEGITASETIVNYFKGNDNRDWKSNIPTYQEVGLGEVYDSIRLNLKAYGKQVEKIFIVEQGGDPEDIAVKLEGVEGLMVDGDGELEIKTGIAMFKMTAPVAYQDINGERVKVAANYKVIDSQSQFVYGFTVGNYNRNYPLVIDPLLASTFIGAGDDDYGYSLGLDSSGNVFITGFTYSLNYPITASAYDTSPNDIFVSKLNNSLTTLLASTFIGGSSDEEAYSLGLDSSGNVFITGYTYSSDYPTTLGAYDTTCEFCDDYYADVFVSKLNNSLTTLQASTFIGGSDDEAAYAFGLDSSGNVFIAGYTYSSDYPTTPGAYDETCEYCADYYADIFVSKLNNSLTSLQSSTFIGGNDEDAYYWLTLDVDSSGNVYIAGDTYSSDYPTTPGAYDETCEYCADYYEDIFVSKLNNILTTLQASTFIGGGDDEAVYALGLDSSGNVFITGYTYSSDYPTTPGAYDTSWNEIFVSKLNNSLTTLQASTFIGGSDYEEPYGLGLDSSGNVFITGYTYSFDYPTTPGAYDRTCGTDGNCNYDEVEDWYYADVFVSKLNNSLTDLLASTFIGGSSDEEAYGLGLDSSGSVFITGYTYSSDYPTTPGAYDRTCGHCDDYYADVFVSKLDFTHILSATPGENQIALDWPGFTDVTSGIASYKLAYSTVSMPTSCTTGVLYTGTGTSYTHTGLDARKTYYYRVCATDNAGNASAATASAKPLDSTAPTGSIMINNDATYTKSTAVTLKISATDPSGVVQMCVSNTASCTAYVAYATSKAWTLPAGNGVKTVNVWFKDGKGNANTIPYPDSITLDVTAP